MNVARGIGGALAIVWLTTATLHVGLTAQTPATASIAGRVIDASSGQGIAGVGLFFRCFDSRSGSEAIAGHEAITDANGDYAITGIASPQCMMLGAPRHADYATTNAGLRRIDLAPGETVRLSTALSRFSRILGQVVDESGTPVAGVPVHMINPLTFAGVTDVAPGPGSLIRTDAQGQFVLERIGRNVMLVLPTAEGDRRVEVPYEPGAETKVAVRIRPAPSFTVSGRLAHPGQSVSSLVVYLDRSDSSTSLPFTVDEVITDETGRFTFSGVPQGAYRVRVGTPLLIGRGPPPPIKYWALLPLDVTGDTSDVVVPLRPGAEVKGTVRFAGAHQVPPPTVAFHFALVDGPGSSSLIWVDALQFGTQTLFPGRYVLRPSIIPPGWRLESAMLNGRDVTEAPFDVGTEPISDIVVTLTDRLTEINGVVRTPAGETVEADVILFSTDPQHWINDGQRRIQRVLASQHGRFSAMNLPPGEYFAAAVPPRGQLRFAADARELLRLSASATRFVLEDGGSVSLAIIRSED